MRYEILPRMRGFLNLCLRDGSSRGDNKKVERMVVVFKVITSMPCNREAILQGQNAALIIFFSFLTHSLPHLAGYYPIMGYCWMLGCLKTEQSSSRPQCFSPFAVRLSPIANTISD